MQNPEKAAVIYSALQAELGDDFFEKPPPESAAPAKVGGSSKKAPPVPKRGGGGGSVPEAPGVPEAPAPPDAPDGPPEIPSGPPIMVISSSSGPKAAPRGGLLDDIKQGYQLKKVTDEKEGGGASRPKSTSAAIPPGKEHSIMGALTQAMGERFKAVQSEDGDGADDDVDDWSD